MGPLKLIPPVSGTTPFRTIRGSGS